MKTILPMTSANCVKDVGTRYTGRRKSQNLTMFDNAYVLRWNSMRWNPMRLYSHDERYVDACVRQSDRFGGGSVMVWGGIAYGRKTPLFVINGNLNAAQYMDRILRPHVVPYVTQHGLTFQQDQASYCWDMPGLSSRQ